MSDFANSETDRRMHNLVRYGRIVEADYDEAMVKVETAEMTTTWLPWITPRAGGDVVWWAPEVGEQVLLLSTSGEIEDSVALAAIYQDAFPPPANGPDICRVRFKDGTIIEYDRAGHKLTADIRGDAEIRCDGDATIKAQNVVLEAQKVTIDAPETRVIGHLRVANGISSEKGGKGIVSAGDVVAGDISLMEHRHDGVRSGGDTSGSPVS